MLNFVKSSTLLLIISILIIPSSVLAAHSGKIYLQVEKNGEAWYVYPVNNQRYFLGRPADAFAIMRGLGLGIADSNLAKIPVGLVDYNAKDTDMDGLPDDLEKAIGTNLYSPDSDNDDFLDKTEIETGNDPMSSGLLPKDQGLVNQLKGRILLQVERNGEAWYVNPTDEKRYFLGRPADAFAIMRQLGIGITNADLAGISINYALSTIKVSVNKEEQYSIGLPSGWSTTTYTEEELDQSDYRVPVTHRLTSNDPTGAAELEIHVIKSLSKNYSLNDFVISSGAYYPVKTTRNFAHDLKPTREQKLKYDTKAKFGNVVFDHGKKIYTHFMISPYDFIELRYYIFNEVDIPDQEQIYKHILNSMDLKYD